MTTNLIPGLSGWWDSLLGSGWWETLRRHVQHLWCSKTTPAPDKTCPNTLDITNQELNID